MYDSHRLARQAGGVVEEKTGHLRLWRCLDFFRQGVGSWVCRLLFHLMSQESQTPKHSLQSFELLQEVSYEQ